MSVKITGLDKLEKQMKKMEKAAKKFKGGTKVGFDELFPPAFMRKYTDFSSFDELLTAGNFEVNSQKDFEAIPDEVLDKHIRNTTHFSSWEQMLNKATEKYVAKELGF